MVRRTSDEGVECSRCGKTFASEDELMVHSVENHVGEQPVAGSSDRGTDVGSTSDPVDLPPETADRLLRLLEERATDADDVLVRYRQRFLLVAGVAVLAIAIALTVLHLRNVVGTTVYMFSLGTLFGLTLSYLQGFVQSARR